MTGAAGLRVPKYYGLKESLREEIAGLPEGAPIAPERALSERFGVSRTTVRQALQELTVEGRLVRMQGRGTFVAKPKMTQTLQLTSYSQDMAAQGLRPASMLLDSRYSSALPDAAEHFEIAVGAPVLRLERLRLADDEPMALETMYLDAGRFPSLLADISNATSVYELLRERYGVELVQAVETIETVLASPAESALLETGTGAPLLLLTRATWDRDGRPVEFVRSLYRGDRYRFLARLERP